MDGEEKTFIILNCCAKETKRGCWLFVWGGWVRRAQEKEDRQEACPKREREGQYVPGPKANYLTVGRPCWHVSAHLAWAVLLSPYLQEPHRFSKPVTENCPWLCSLGTVKEGGQSLAQGELGQKEEKRCRSWDERGHGQFSREGRWNTRRWGT